MNLRYTEQAKQDLTSAFGWYESQQKGLGFAFLDNVETAIQNLRKFPKMYEMVYANYRRCVIRRFPFSIFYTIELNEVVIHAVFDNRQDPTKAPISGDMK